MAMNEYWRIFANRGEEGDILIHEGSDINKAYIRIGQMALSTGIEQIIVYRNDSDFMEGKEYRRYELKQGARIA